jgi:hypothetical protein
MYSKGVGVIVGVVDAVYVAVIVGVNVGVAEAVKVAVSVAVRVGVGVAVGFLGVLEIPLSRAALSPVTSLPFKVIDVSSICLSIFPVNQDLILQSSLNSSLPGLHCPLEVMYGLLYHSRNILSFTVS